MKKFWTYDAGGAPELSELPSGTFKGTVDDWNKLSPGFKREILKQAVDRLCRKV